MHDLGHRGRVVGLRTPSHCLAEAEHSGAETQEIIALLVAQLSSYLVCQNESLFSSEENVTKFFPSGLNARAVTGA